MNKLFTRMILSAAMAATVGLAQARDLGMIFSDSAEMTTSGYTGEEVLDFPILVRISEELIPGFKYERAGETGEKIAFTSAGLILPYEVASWNPNGESLIWVKVPSLTATRKLTFWWYPWAGANLPENHPEEVWSAYQGVWHMDEEIAQGDEAASAVSVDATGHGLDATPASGTVGDIKRMKSVAGVVGNARVLENDATAAGIKQLGNRLVIPGAKLSLGNTFTFSTWIKIDGYGGGRWPQIACMKATNSSGNGWSIEHSTTRRNFYVRGNGGVGFNATVFPTEPNQISEFTHVAFAYAGRTLTVYANGEQVAEDTIEAVQDNDLDLWIGGGYPNLAEASVWGKYDEMRLIRKAMTPAQAKAEYESIAKADFLVYAAAKTPNPWDRLPSISPTSWEMGTSDDEIAIDLGKAHSGELVKVTFAYDDAPETVLPDLAYLTRPGSVTALFKTASGVQQIIPLTIYEPNPNIYTDLGGTASGRILLGNNDTLSGHEIYGQMYSEQDPTLETYWDHTLPVRHPLDHAGLYDPSLHTLYLNNGANAPKALWTLTDVWMGDYGAAAPKASCNYLPVSSSAVEPAVFALRNVAGAEIRSQFFADGIGSLYFDAVNGSVKDPAARLVVEIAEPVEGDEDPVWKTVPVTVLKKNAGEPGFATDKTQLSDSVSLAITTGGATDAFYRVIALIDHEGPVAVRIRRPRASSTALAANQILVDNIIVSKPAVKVSIQPLGEYNPDESGAYVLGQACAFTVPFPSKNVSDLKGRAQLTFTETLDGKPSDYLEFVKLRWRWRYLNQQLEPAEEVDGRAWNVADFDLENVGDDGVLTTRETLDLNGNAGDLEWYYDAVVRAPAYRYVDYTGLQIEQPTAGVHEDLRALESHATVPVGDRFASGGTDWFLRLREGESDIHRLQVEIRAEEGAEAMTLPGLYDMELVGNHLWRVFIPVPEGAEGVCRYRFRALNRQQPGATKIMPDDEAFGPKSDETFERMGALVEGATWGLYKIDHIAGYLQIQMNDLYLTYQLSRAEYQNFNYWNDAHTFGDQFKIDSTDTNSVNAAEMKIFVADMGKWPLFEVSSNAWELFSVNDYAPTTGRFIKEIFHQSHETPNADWTAHNFTFVSSKFAGSGESQQKSSSGLAAKLRGGAQGYTDYVSSKTPLGIEKVDVAARLGQSLDFEAMTYSAGAYKKKNYSVLIPFTMSHLTPDDGSQPGDMAVGASFSVIGYHRPGKGCYEVRVTRPYSGKTIRMTINKWEMVDYAWVCNEIEAANFPLAAWRNEFNKQAGEMPIERDRKYYAMLVSFEPTTDGEGNPTGGTRILSAITQSARKVYNEAPWKSFSSGDVNPADPTAAAALKWNLLVHNDMSEPFTSGAYGIISKDCPAKIVLPSHQDRSYPSAGYTSNGYYTNKDLSMEIEGAYHFESDAKDLLDEEEWATIPGRMESFWVEEAGSSAYPWVGLQAPTNLAQRLDLYLRPNGTTDESKWEKIDTITVTGYEFKNYSFTVKSKGKYDIRLKTGEGNPFDVTLSSIKPYKWQGDDIPSNLSSEETFHYTQAYVETNTVRKTNFVRLQPARAEVSRSLAIRTPVLHGLGKFTFNYDPETLDPNAEVWVQVATNNVIGDLDGVLGLNNALETDERWVTLAKMKAGAEDPMLNLADGSSKTVYLGWHNYEKRPITGLFRLIVPSTIVAEAERNRADDYGSITITGISCTDEPGASDQSWYAWNMRTVGDEADSERRMTLADMKIADGAVGLVAALNNSTRDVVDRQGRDIDPLDERLGSEKPTIFSPMLRPVKADDGVGQVSFKARLYARPGEEGNLGKGVITVYGTRDALSSGWEELTKMEVTTTVASNYLWNATGHGTYRRMKFVVDDPSAVTPDAALARVIIDELVISEKETPTIGVVYARPFRNDLLKTTPIDDIMSPREQPLSGESWGVQAQLKLQQLTDQVDAEKGFEVYLSYYRGEQPWGYEQWKNDPAAVSGVPLTLVDADNLIFRSVGTTADSLVKPGVKSSEIVQFMLTIKYYLRVEEGAEPLSDTVTMSEWQAPEWYYPIDLNGKYSQTPDPIDPEHFAAYAILDTVSPGRAWINEVNWNDGTREENASSSDTVTNQFVEICIPQGVDMSGWKLRMTDVSANARTFASFGDTAHQIPARKVSEHAVNGYEFFVLQSPETKRAGGIKVTGTSEPAADATWYEDDLGEEVTGGTLSYCRPYQFELVRPSGIVEHQFVLDGTNTMRRFGDWTAMYDGTNLVKTLNEIDNSPRRFYAGEDLARKLDEAVFASVGVTDGRDDVDTSYWPGGSNTWHASMGFTPGRLNEGQTIPENWFIKSNGKNSWVRFELASGNLKQKIGEETGNLTLVLVPEGETTNVVYTVDAWHTATLVRDGEAVEGYTGKGGTFTYTFTPEGDTTIVASATPEEKMASIFGLTKENPYTPAVMSWLLTNWGDKGLTADDIRLARYLGLKDKTAKGTLSLTEMYWLDIPPVPETEEEKLYDDGENKDGTNWWFRVGIADGPKDHRVRLHDSTGELSMFTNKQIAVTLYASNACTKAAWAPKHLQGLHNEKSDAFTGDWTSVTFKVTGNITLAPSKDFLPLRVFTFDADSFSPAEAETPFTAVIDVLDPFKSPIGLNYGWGAYPNTSANFTFSIDTDVYPYTVETLKADSTYKESAQD